jgi:pyrroloquinoline-quinone synthase
MRSAELFASDALASPPPPPIPELTSPLSANAFVEALRRFSESYYAVHPFHTAMHEGSLSARQLRGWAANRLAYQRAIPRKDAAIIANCPDPEVRCRWIQRIIDHDGTGDGSNGGIARWIQLGIALGVPREEMEDERHVLPGVRMAAESYVTFCRTKPWVEAVASSLTELFAPDLMRRRIDAFEKHYHWIDPQALTYFRSRLTQAPRDSEHGLEIVTTHCTSVDSQLRAFEALAFKLEMLWVMIDTIARGYPE